MLCPQCKKETDNSTAIEFIEKIGICPACDHLETDVDKEEYGSEN